MKMNKMPGLGIIASVMYMASCASAPDPIVRYNSVSPVREALVDEERNLCTKYIDVNNNGVFDGGDFYIIWDYRIPCESDLYKRRQE